LWVSRYYFARLIYVEYLRSDVTQAHASGKAPVLTERILSELPVELLKKLCHVTVVLYRSAITVLIERVETHAPDTAKGLQRLVHGFQFERIREMLEELE
jgi:hypothetical protein